MSDSAIYGAAIFKRRGPILSHPVAFDTSICLKKNSTVSFETSGKVNTVPSGFLLLQNVLSLSKFEFSIGSFRFDATETKKIVESICNLIMVLSFLTIYFDC